MRYQAVIFDLFGTLVPNLSLPKHKAVLAEMARALGVPAEPFVRGWLTTGPLRMSGAIPTPEDNAALICRDLGVAPDPEALSAAGRIRRAYSARSLLPRPGSVEVLVRIREGGRRIGLITDCSSEVPPRWDQTSFHPLVHATVFSCVERTCKPDPRLYHLACERLGVIPGACLYVGDGGSRELSGAAAVGMRPVLIVEKDPDAHRFGAEAWAGERISALSEVPALLDE